MAPRVLPVLLALLLSSCAVGGPAAAPSSQVQGPAHCRVRLGLPDPACTPGEVDPRVTPTNLARTICRGGYAGSVRPPESVTHAIKVRQVRAYGLSGVPFARIELDHLVPLSLGGASSERNLWPELRAGPAGAQAKDQVEVRLHGAVCGGRVGLRAAQQAIAVDWRTAP